MSLIPGVTPSRSSRRIGRLAAAAGCLLLFGCDLPPPSADVGFGGSRTPPAAFPSAPGSRDGVYVGTADVVVNGDFMCPQHMSITNFRVEGDAIRFGGFHGTIVDGAVASTPFRGMWLTGRFEGPKFVGHIDAMGDAAGLFKSCIYGFNVVRQTSGGEPWGVAGSAHHRGLRAAVKLALDPSAFTVICRQSDGFMDASQSMARPRLLPGRLTGPRPAFQPPAEKP
jgi:hypothetical protein